MNNYIVKDGHIEFRQSFDRTILCKLFTTLMELEITILDGANKVYPHRVNISESEFLSVIEMIS